MWFFYVLWTVGALASICSLIVVVAIAAYLVRQAESPRKQAPDNPEGPGLVDITRSHFQFDEDKAA